MGRIGWRLEKDPYRYHPCTHGGTILQLQSEDPPLFGLAAAVDTDPDAREGFLEWWNGSGHPDPAPVDDYSQILKENPPDLLVIATPVSTHLDMAVIAIQSGVRGVLLEKPPSFTAAQTDRILETSRKHGVPVWLNFERRFHPSYRALKERILRGDYGKIRSVRGRVFTGSGFDQNSECGPLLHDAIHWIDLLIWIFGQPEKVSGEIRKEEGVLLNESATLLFHYKDFIATLESDGRRKYFEFTLDLDFEEARVEAGNYGFRLLRRGPSERYQGFLELKAAEMELPTGNPWPEMYREIHTVMSEGRGAEVRMLEDVREAMRLVEGAEG